MEPSMDYKRIYDQLIERARNRVPEGYVERHHVKPRCMGGNDKNENLAALYPEEHFVAHALLLKIYKETEHRYALAKAVQQMCVGHDGRRVRRKLYGWLKREHSLAMSAMQSGEGNSQFGSRWICNPSTQQNSKQFSSEDIPEGWILGRNKWKKKSPDLKTKICKFCQKEFLKRTKSQYCSRSHAQSDRQTKIYVVEGQEFSGLKAVAKHLKIHVSTVSWHLKTGKVRILL